jgi:uncharacterized membrane protein
MNRNEFLSRLRRGLEGAAPDQIHDVMRDYEMHFIDGQSQGRTEQEIAAALGDPARLARELKAEAGFKRWEERKTPSNMAGAVLALLGLATVDIMLLFPFLFPLAIVMMALFAASFGLAVGGFVLCMASIFPGALVFGITGMMGGALAMGLLGIGFLAGGIGMGSLIWLISDWLIRLLVRYARLHFQLIENVTV